MRVYDGLQWFELHARRGPAPPAGEVIEAHRVARVLADLPPGARGAIVDFLVAEFGWPPHDFDRQDAALARLVQLVEDDQALVLGFAPSGSVSGDVPDEDDVQPLSELIEEEEDEAVDARLTVEAPMGIEPEFEIADPVMPAFDFEVG